MTLPKDIAFCLKPRCPACQRGRLFKRGSLTVVERCDVCGVPLGKHDAGDAAAVIMIFILGFMIVPTAWAFEKAFAPALWVHVVLWGAVALGMIAVLLPTAKAFIILQEYRHRSGDWGK